jgi:hypothetical protein
MSRLLHGRTQETLILLDYPNRPRSQGQAEQAAEQATGKNHEYTDLRTEIERETIVISFPRAVEETKLP